MDPDLNTGPNEHALFLDSGSGSAALVPDPQPLVPNPQPWFRIRARSSLYFQIY